MSKEGKLISVFFFYEKANKERRTGKMPMKFFRDGQDDE